MNGPVIHDADQLAAALRADPPPLDDLSRARMERRVLAGGQADAAPSEAAPPRGNARAWAFGGGLVGLAVAASVGLVVLAGQEPGGAESGRAPVAHFEVHEVEVSARRGTLEEGSVLPTSPGEEAVVRVADSRVTVSPATRVRIATLRARRLGLELDQGAVEVHFHPREPGREHLSVVTPEARIEVVGTVFTVRRVAGATDVEVREGVVRVISRVDGTETRVAAGERAHVEGPTLAAVEGGAVRSGAVGSDAVDYDTVDYGAAADHAGTVDQGTVDQGTVDQGTVDQGTVDQGTVDQRMGEAADSEISAAAVLEPGREPSTGLLQPGSGAEAPRDDERGEEVVAGARRATARRSAEPEVSVSPTAAEELARARALLGSGDAPAAEPILRDLSRSGPTGVRVQALTLLADLERLSGRLPEAQRSYSEAARLGVGTMAGANAIYALARLQERQVRDPAAARASYRRYLTEAPDGPLGTQAQAALCRLGARDECP